MSFHPGDIVQTSGYVYRFLEVLERQGDKVLCQSTMVNDEGDLENENEVYNIDQLMHVGIARPVYEDKNES